MKTTVKLILIVTCCVLLQARVFCDDAIGASLVTAVNNAATSIIGQLKNSANSINQQLSDVFNNMFASSSGDNAIASYVKNFYQWFTTDNFHGLTFPNSTDSTPNPNIDNKIKGQENSENVRTQLLKEVGYNTKKDVFEKYKDTQELFKLPFESSSSGGNTSGATGIAGLSGLLGWTQQATSTNSSSPTAYGSMDDSSPIADKAPSIINLIGKDGYTNDEQQQAKLFISYTLQAVPPPKNISIPSVDTAKDGKITMYLPYTEEGGCINP